MDEPVDLVVIGGGTAGIIAATTAADLGARVVLIERGRTGGDCLWTGCVPSKTLIAAAGRVHAARRAGGYLAGGRPRVDFAAVMADVRRAIEAIEPADSPAALGRAGVEVIRARARFTGPRTVLAGERTVPFRRAVIATGSAPALPPVPGLADVEPLTSDTVWDLTELPERLAVLGGGTVGCELGQALARLGAEVTVVEAAERLLPRAEPRASAVLAARLAADGIRVSTLTTFIAATREPSGVRLRLRGPDGDAELWADRVLVATGRTPRTADLDLAAAGVTTGRHGHVLVDARGRTGNRRIYAAGDVTGAPAFTHVAGVHGGVVATNAVLGTTRRPRGPVPEVTFTDPEIAHAGATEEQAHRRYGDAVRVRHLRHTHLDRAVTEGDTDGFTRLVLGRHGRLLGVTIVAPRAGEMLAEPAAVIARGGRVRDIASVMHAYPTWADGVWHASLAESRATLSAPAKRRVIALLLRLRRATRS